LESKSSDSGRRSFVGGFSEAPFNCESGRLAWVLPIADRLAITVKWDSDGDVVQRNDKAVSQRMPTIKDVAKLASVSTATVSATLNGTAYVSPELRSRVERAVAELAYTTDGIARSLKRGVTNLIGLIVDDATAPFYMSLVEQISLAAFAKGYSLLLCPTGRDASTERKYLSLLRSHRVSGIIWSPTGRVEDYPAVEFTKFSIPIVFVDRVLPSFSGYDSVLLNNRAAGLQAANYLLDLGHRRIAMITGTDYIEPSHGRREGYEEAFRRRGLEVNPTLVRNGQFRDAEAFSECLKLLSADKSVTAILIGSDQMFVGVMRALQHLDLSCPQHISIATIDDFPLAGVFNPPMTTIRQPIQEMAGVALDLLIRRLSLGALVEPRHHVVEPTLIVRGSCAPVAANLQDARSQRRVRRSL
jgi:LacI family transcriptional regulator